MQTPLSIQTNPSNIPMFENYIISSSSSLSQIPNSCRVSPKLSYSHNELNIKKSWTAPTSPIHTYRCNIQNNNQYLDKHLMTPQSSPTFLENSSLQLPELQLSQSNVSNPGITKRNVTLPSLKHLQLLPDPRIQENSYVYPDTSERTPMWRNTLLNWCKTEKYHDYISIKEQDIKTRNYYTANIPKMRTTTTNTMTTSNTNTNANMTTDTGLSKVFSTSNVPSILQSKDPFYGLSSKPWEFQSPLTPPMSPGRTSQPTFDKKHNTTNQKDNLSNGTNNHDIFNPIISEKLIQCIKKQQIINSNRISKSTSSVNTHKKTNSFKALQIKKMLMDRDVLSINSKKNSTTIDDNNNNNNQSKSSSKSIVITNFVTSSTTTTTANKKIKNNNHKNDSNVFMPANEGTTITATTTLLSSPTLSPNVSRSDSPIRRKKNKDNRTPNNNTSRSRSRSHSPVRIVNFSNTITTPPPPPSSLQYNHNNNSHNCQKTNYSLPRYHTFSLSGSSSPIYLTQQTNHIEDNNYCKNIHNSHNTNSYGSNIMLYSTNSNKKISSKALPRSFSAPNSTNTSPLRGKERRSSHTTTRKCVSCNSQDSPCWRPSWSKKRQHQLCNSCGLRYKKTKTRCLNMRCKKIPTKGELNIMKSQGKTTGTVANNPDIIGPVVGYRCLFCNSITETLD